MGDDFERRWKQVRGMTLEFLTSMPEVCLNARPAQGFASVRDQAVHLIERQGVFHAGFRGEPIDFSRVGEYTPANRDTPTLVAALEAMDAELTTLLAAAAPDFSVDWFGERLGLWEYGSVLIQHEALHHGQWVVHARLGGWQPPLGWLLSWSV